MARTGVTFLDVSKAAQAVKERGNEPTVDRVRERLGTGSKSTIGPLLKRWREEKGEAVDAGGLPSDLVEVIRSLHERLQSNADERVDQVKSELQSTIDELQQRLGQNQASLGQTKADKLSLESELHKVRADNDSLKKEMEDLRLKASKTESQRDEAWSRIAELKYSLDEQKEENRALRENYEHYQQKTAEVRQQERDEYRLAAQHHLSQIQQLLEQATKSETRYMELQSEHRTLRNDYETQRTDLQSNIERFAKFKADMEALALRLKESVSERDALHQQREAAQDRTASLASELSAARENAKHLQQLLDRAHQMLHSANQRIEEVVDENRLIRQEKAVFQGQLKQLQASL